SAPLPPQLDGQALVVFRRAVPGDRGGCWRIWLLRGSADSPSRVGLPACPGERSSPCPSSSLPHAASLIPNFRNRRRCPISPLPRRLRVSAVKGTFPNFDSAYAALSLGSPTFLKTSLNPSTAYTPPPSSRLHRPATLKPCAALKLQSSRYLT